MGLRADEAGRRNPEDASVNWDRLFDDKVALSQAYAYNGKHGEEWATTTRGYFMTRLNSVKTVLEWVEKQEHSEVTMDSVIEAKRAGSFIDLEEHELHKLSARIWQFLNHCVSGDARHTFRGADQLNGFEGWRLLIIEFRKGSWFRKETLRRACKFVPPIAKLEDIPAAIVQYDQRVKDYEAVTVKGKIDDDERKSDLLQALPEAIRESFQTRHAMPEPYRAFRDVLLHTTNTMLFQRGKFPMAVGAVERQPDAPAAVPQPTDNEEAYYDNLAAAIWRKGKGKGKNGGAPREPGGKSGGKGDDARRCVNCGKTDHESRDCPAGVVPREKRPCWKCGKPGHVGAQCPAGRGGGGGAARLVDNAAGDVDLMDFFGCVTEAPDDDDGDEHDGDDGLTSLGNSPPRARCDFGFFGFWQNQDIAMF